MDLLSDDDVKGIVEEMAEDRGRIMNRRISNRKSGLRTEHRGWTRTLFFGGIAVLILTAALILLTGGDDPKESEAWQDLASRIEAMEGRLARMESSTESIPALAGRIEGLGKGLKRIEKNQKALTSRIDRLTRRMEGLSARSAPDHAGPPSATGKGARHTVRKGETLFSIARRYGLSLDRLCRLNGIPKTAVIRPGETLLVSKED